MQTYKEFAPTQFDPRGLGLRARQAWLVAPVVKTRDSGPLERTNFDSAYEALAATADSDETVDLASFNHWGPGWYEIVLVKPGSEAETVAADIEAALADYPVLDDEAFSEAEQSEADETWSNCYRPAERIAYIRKFRSQFEFHDMRDLLAVVRGEYFSGYASDLIN